jgi:hypothetical protein
MATISTNWRPAWWSEDVHGSAWARVKEGMRRDWLDTTHDLGLGIRELEHGATNGGERALAERRAPTSAGPGSPPVVGEWGEAEIPYGYGYAARFEYGEQYPSWSEALEQTLKEEWVVAHDHDNDQHWERIRGFVRRGYDYEGLEGEGAEVPSSVDVVLRTHDTVRCH